MNDKHSGDFRQILSDYFDGRCSVCNGTGWSIRDGLAYRCQCYNLEAAENRLKAARIPDSYRHCTLENFSATHFKEGEINNLLKALKHANQFVKRYQTPECLGRGLLFRGPVGVGKTHLAVAILQNLINQGFSGLFLNFIHLIEKIKQSYVPEKDIFEPQLFKQISRSHIVVLDELGAAKPTEFVFNKLYDIINYCFDNNISVLFTTNYHDEPGKDKRRPNQNFESDSRELMASKDTLLGSYTLSERITVRLRSRILERCDDIIMQGKDYRLTRHNTIR